MSELFNSFHKNSGYEVSPVHNNEPTEVNQSEIERAPIDEKMAQEIGRNVIRALSSEDGRNEINMQEIYSETLSTSDPNDALLKELIPDGQEERLSRGDKDEEILIYGENEGETIYQTEEIYATPQDAINAVLRMPSSFLNIASRTTEQPIDSNNVPKEGELGEIEPSIIDEIANKARNNKAFTGAMTMLFVVMITASILTACGKKSNTDPTKPSANPAGEGERPAYEYVINKDAYSEPGMWESENKGGPYNFASAEEVAEIKDNDPKEMLKYTASNQLEAVADYITGLPDELKPEEFNDLTAHEAEQKLQDMPDEEYEETVKNLFEIFDTAEYETVKIKGLYDNAYMKLKDSSEGTSFENMELVQCETDENIEVTALSWEGVSKRLLIKAIPQYDDDHNIIGYKGCMQVIEKQGSSDRYDGLKEIESPEEDTNKPNNPGETTTEKLKEKNQEAQKQNAGPRAEQQPQTGQKTDIKEDQKVVGAAEEQIKGGGMAGSSEDKAKQAAVDSQAGSNDAEAAGHANDTAEDRANAYANGDY